MSNHRRLRGDACNPQRAGPLGSEDRSCSAAPVHPHNLWHCGVAPAAQARHRLTPFPYLQQNPLEFMMRALAPGSAGGADHDRWRSGDQRR
jgi:hypothetical protein